MSYSTKLEAWLNKILNQPKIFKTLPQIQKGQIIGNTLELFMHIINDYIISAFNASTNGPHENRDIIKHQLTFIYMYFLYWKF